jgi:hypothetical protein
MKKILLLGLALSAGAGFEAAHAQGWGTQIGKTFYDLQSNVSVGNRIVRHSDGTVSAVWIESCAAGAPSFSTRGTGYNVPVITIITALPGPKELMVPATKLVQILVLIQCVLAGVK